METQPSSNKLYITEFSSELRKLQVTYISLDTIGGRYGVFAYEYEYNVKFVKHLKLKRRFEGRCEQIKQIHEYNGSMYVFAHTPKKNSLFNILTQINQSLPQYHFQ